MKRRIKAFRPVVLYGMAFAALVSVYPSLMRPIIRRNVFNQLTTGLGSAVAMTSGEVDSWAQAHRIQALTLARVAQLELTPSRSGISPRNAMEFSLRFGAILDSLSAPSRFTEAWVLGENGVVLAHTRNAGAPASGTRDIEVARDPAGDVFVDFLGTAPDARSPRVVIRSRLSAATFTRLDPGSNRSARTTRTSILMRDGDSIHVVILSARGATVAGRAYAAANVPESYRQAFRGTSRGLARGAGGSPAFYATGTIPSLQLPIVREVDEAEVLTQFRTGLVVQGALGVGLLLALIYLSQSRWQAAQLRREREMMRVRDDFVSSVSHELRTPLTQIRMYAELMRTGSLRGQADTDRALAVIEKEARRLAILVDNVLNFARLKRRTQEANGMVTDVADETRQVIDGFSPLAAERGVRVHSDVPERLYARVDSLALRQLLLNLLENAVKYGPRNQRVVIAAEVVGSMVCVSVEDEGPGVPEGERARIWEPFYRGQSAPNHDVTGSGIGLSVVQDLVVRHGGTVHVRQASSGGARFEVCFPRADGLVA